MLLTILTLFIILLRPRPFPVHSNIFSFPFVPLYSPQFTSLNLLINPFFESLRNVAFHYFNYLSPKFLFTVLYPVEIVLVSLGIYSLAIANNKKLNYFWFLLLIVSPFISGLLLIVPLSILVAAGWIYLIKKHGLLWRFTTISFLLIWIFQFVRQLDLFLIKK
jgi:hypothetical protein